MLTLLAFLVTIILVVTVHEYGHFQVARWCGVKVLRFSIGMGNALWSKKLGVDQTEYVVAAIPLGGYVKMLDERELEGNEEVQPQDLQRAFNRQSVWKRMVIVLAGPVANFLLAIILFWLVFISGVAAIKPIVGEVEKDSPAFFAGLQTGDVIQRIDGQVIKSWQDLRWAMLDRQTSTSPVEVEVLSANNELHTYVLDLSRVKSDDVDVMGKIGFSAYRPLVSATIERVISGGVAEKAGLQSGDLVTYADGKIIRDGGELVSLIRANPNKLLHLRIKRGDELIIVSITPESEDIEGKIIGRIGAAFKVPQEEVDRVTLHVDYSIFGAATEAVVMTWNTSLLSLKMMWRMVKGEMSLKGMSGPIGVADVAGQSAGIGVKAFVGFVAFISISIGIFNLLPIPVLDGGHLMYYIAETIKGSPVSEAVMRTGQHIGMVFLGMLFFVAIFNDITRLIS